MEEPNVLKTGWRYIKSTKIELKNSWEDIVRIHLQDQLFQSKRPPSASKFTYTQTKKTCILASWVDTISSKKNQLLEVRIAENHLDCLLYLIREKTRNFFFIIIIVLLQTFCRIAFASMHRVEINTLSATLILGKIDSIVLV